MCGIVARSLFVSATEQATVLGLSAGNGQSYPGLFVHSNISIPCVQHSRRLQRVLCRNHVFISLPRLVPCELTATLEYTFSGISPSRLPPCPPRSLPPSLPQGFEEKSPEGLLSFPGDAAARVPRMLTGGDERHSKGSSPSDFAAATAAAATAAAATVAPAAKFAPNARLDAASASVEVVDGRTVVRIGPAERINV